MKFLNNYIAKTVLVVVILLVSIPLVMPAKKLTVTHEEAAASARPVAKNPFMSVFDRITDFYGLTDTPAAAKEAAKHNPAALEGASFDIYGNPLGLSKPPVNEKLAKNQIQSSYIGEGGAVNSSSGAAVGGSSIAAQSGARHAAAGDSAEKTGIEPRALTFEGKDYDVANGASGQKYVLTARGPVEIDRFLDRGAVYNNKQAAFAGASAPATGIVTREEYMARAGVGGGGIEAAGKSAGSVQRGAGSGAGGAESGAARGSGGISITAGGMSGAYNDAKGKASSARGSGGGGNSGGSSGGGAKAQAGAAALQSAPRQDYLAQDKVYMQDLETAGAVNPRTEELDTSIMYRLLPTTTLGADYTKDVAVQNNAVQTYSEANKPKTATGF